MPILQPVKESRFHGRSDDSTRPCDKPGCGEAGEFRAPGTRGHGFDGPGEWRWMCLKHVREFNAGYDWFEGMSAEQIFEAQAPANGWRTESPSFRPNPGIDGMPRWTDFDDPLEAIAARANGIKSRAWREAEMTQSKRFNHEEVEALAILGLGSDFDRAELRRRYTELVRRYHPDQNGGDRQFENRLNRVVEAYQLLRRSRAIN